MKKLIFLIITLALISGLQFYSNASEESNADYEIYTSMQYEDTNDSTECARQCSGRNPTSDACNKCNNCEGWGSDAAVATCRNPN